MDENEIENLQRDKLELKIIIAWARGLAAQSMSGMRGGFCGAIFAVCDDGIKNPNRRRLLAEAPDWLRKEWPQYFKADPSAR